MILNSSSRYIKAAVLPNFNSLQHYMAKTNSNKVVLPNNIKHYEPIVQDLCSTLNYDGIIHVTVDEKLVKKGKTQRKPELHVDGRFSGMDWSHPYPGWNHVCNELPIPRMSVAVISNLARCKVYHGKFEATPSEQGDLSHIRHLVGDGKLVPANEWHLLTPDCVHESLPFEVDAERIFVRVAFETHPLKDK